MDAWNLQSNFADQRAMRYFAGGKAGVDVTSGPYPVITFSTPHAISASSGEVVLRATEDVGGGWAISHWTPLSTVFVPYWNAAVNPDGTLTLGKDVSLGS